MNSCVKLKSAFAIITGEQFFSVNVDAALLASSNNSLTSTPIKAAGTNPKAVNALKRPPTFGSALITLYPLDRASISKAEAGSVITTK